VRIDTSEPSLTALFNKGQVGLIRTEFMRKDDVIAEHVKKNAALAAEYVELKDLYIKCRIDIGNLHKENNRLRAEVEWLRKADRLVCWNPTTQQWEVRHESPK